MLDIIHFDDQIKKLKFDTMIFNIEMLNNDVMKFCIMNNIRIMSSSSIPFGNVDLYLNNELVFSINLNTGHYIDLT
jgi:hypothetical protein